MKLTRQGVRDLNDIRSLNGHIRDKQKVCKHDYKYYIDNEDLMFRRCLKCEYEDV